MTPLLLTFDLI